MILCMECLISIILFTVIVIPVALMNPKYIVEDYPLARVKRCIELKIIPERRTRFTKKEIIKKVVAGILFVTILAFIVYKFNGANNFASGFINSYIIWFAVCWYDAIILDCIFFCNFKRFRIPGTEDMKEYKDYLFHIKGSLRGSLIGLPACMLVGLLVLLL